MRLNLNQPGLVLHLALLICFASGSPPAAAQSQATNTTPVKSYDDPSASTAPQTPSVTVQPKNRKLKYQIEIAGSKPWTDTGIDLLPQDQVSMSSTGKPVSDVSSQSSCDPAGQPRSWWDLLHALPVNSSGRDALIGLVGDASTSVPFLVGAKFEQKMPQAGRLFLGVNEIQNMSAACTYKVTIAIQPAPPPKSAKALTVTPTTIPQLSADLLNQIPRRVSDATGNAGDMVNFIIIGPQKSLEAAFESAGWVAVDRTKQDATLHAILSSLSKKSYVEMPMSELYLFNRPQDYGFARAEPLEVVTTRHHLRIWRAPFDWNAQPVWVGAATHDIGFDRDDRNGGITHKIDPAVDLEREFVAQSLNATGAIGSLGHVLPSNPLLNANTATGETFHSDGQILVMSLN